MNKAPVRHAETPDVGPGSMIDAQADAQGVRPCCDDPEALGDILPRVLVDLDARRRRLTPDQLAQLDYDVRELAPALEIDE